MRRRAALLTVATTLALGACEPVVSLLPASQLDCDGAAPELCQQLARIAISEMNLTATGPITLVVLKPVECVRWAQSNFLGDLSRATGCWTAEVTGEQSRGGGTIVLWPDGSLEPFW